MPAIVPHPFAPRQSSRLQVLQTVPNGINSSGQIVGSADLKNDVQSHAALWNKGAVTDLGAAGYLSSTAMAINDAGQIVGSAGLPGNQTHAVYWNGSEMTDVGTLGGDTAMMYAINNSGEFVGSSIAADLRWHAFIGNVAGGGMNDLNDLLVRSPGSDWIVTGATDINNLGNIIGAVYSPSQNLYGLVVLTPVPEPGDYLLLMAGILAFICWNWRRDKIQSSGWAYR